MSRKKPKAFTRINPESYLAPTKSTIAGPEQSQLEFRVSKCVASSRPHPSTRRMTSGSCPSWTPRQINAPSRPPRAWLGDRRTFCRRTFPPRPACRRAWAARSSGRGGCSRPSTGSSRVAWPCQRGTLAATGCPALSAMPRPRPLESRL